MANVPVDNHLTEVPRGGPAVPDETSLLGMRHRELDELFRASPPGEIPTGVLDGTAILFPGRRPARPLAAVVRGSSPGGARWWNRRAGPCATG